MLGPFFSFAQLSHCKNDMSISSLIYSNPVSCYITEIMTWRGLLFVYSQSLQNCTTTDDLRLFLLLYLILPVSESTTLEDKEDVHVMITLMSNYTSILMLWSFYLLLFSYLPSTWTTCNGDVDYHHLDHTCLLPSHTTVFLVWRWFSLPFSVPLPKYNSLLMDGKLSL